MAYRGSKAASSVVKPVEYASSDDDMVDSSVVKPAHDAADFCLCSYNITWDKGKITGHDHKKHYERLEADLNLSLIHI